jgi:hypothetical protein
MALRFSVIAIALALLAAIVYCVLGPQTFMSRIWWIPDWVGQWADRHPYFRNFLPFAALSALLFVAWSSFSPLPSDSTRHSPQVTRHSTLSAQSKVYAVLIFQRALVCALLVSVLGTGLELIQQLVPERVGNFHHMQICWSVAGALSLTKISL